MTTEDEDKGRAVAVKPLVEGTVMPIVNSGGRAFMIPRDLRDAVKLADLMSQAHGFVPSWLIGNAGGCLAVIDRAMNWGFSPFAVAQKCYQTSPGSPIGYESQLVHAAVLKNAPLAGRLFHAIEGEGDARRCRVWATLKGETEPREFISEPLGALRPPSGDRGVKGSPLWAKKPEVQLIYNATRDWARVYCPDVLMGAYTRDEIIESFTIDAPPVKMIDPFAGDGPSAEKGRASDASPSSANTAAPSSPEAGGSSDETAPASASDEGGESSDSPLTPREQGAHAADIGCPESNNPFPESSAEWLEWIEGFHGGADVG